MKKTKRHLLNHEVTYISLVDFEKQQGIVGLKGKGCIESLNYDYVEVAKFHQEKEGFK